MKKKIFHFIETELDRRKRKCQYLLRSRLKVNPHSTNKTEPPISVGEMSLYRDYVRSNPPSIILRRYTLNAATIVLLSPALPIRVTVEPPHLEDVACIYSHVLALRGKGNRSSRCVSCYIDHGVAQNKAVKKWARRIALFALHVLSISLPAARSFLQKDSFGAAGKH